MYRVYKDLVAFKHLKTLNCSLFFNNDWIQSLIKSASSVIIIY